MKRIILITASFPYLGGEQFLETEVALYRERNTIEVTIVPLVKTSNIYRELGKNITLDNFIINKKPTKLSRIFYLIKSLKSKYFYNELKVHKFNTFKKFKVFLSSISLFQMYYEYFANYLKTVRDLENMIIYTYWHNEATYALQALKSKFNYKLISRIHGHDIYKERKPENYMPLKKQFMFNIDQIYTITQSANAYLVRTYGFDYKLLSLSRLGVNDFNIISLPTNTNTFHIVSCAFLSEVKRVDKVIDALVLLTRINKNINYIWTHIGDGKLFEKLKKDSQNKLGKVENIKINFLGNLENKDIYKFYQNNKVDVFINTSESEGVPVSIMEAMSCHIPIVAPEVGGVSDMIDNGENGYLLSEEFLINEMVNALKNITFFKHPRIREHSYQIFRKKYNANINYKQFISNWSQI